MKPTKKQQQKTKSAQDLLKEMESKFDIGSNDVICGRNCNYSLLRKTKANRKFYQLINAWSTTYDEPSKKKRKVCEEVVDTIYTKGGRFLRVDYKKEIVEQLSRKQAIMKTSQSFRDFRRSGGCAWVSGENKNEPKLPRPGSTTSTTSRSQKSVPMRTRSSKVECLEFAQNLNAVAPKRKKVEQLSDNKKTAVVVEPRPSPRGKTLLPPRPRGKTMPQLISTISPPDSTTVPSSSDMIEDETNPSPNNKNITVDNYEEDHHLHDMAAMSSSFKSSSSRASTSNTSIIIKAEQDQEEERPIFGWIDHGNKNDEVFTKPAPVTSSRRVSLDCSLGPSRRASMLSSCLSLAPERSAEEEDTLYHLPRGVGIGSSSMEEEEDGCACVAASPTTTKSTVVNVPCFPTPSDMLLPFSSNCFMSVWDDENSKLDHQLNKESEEVFPMSDLEWKILLDSNSSTAVDNTNVI